MTADTDRKGSQQRSQKEGESVVSSKKQRERLRTEVYEGRFVQARTVLSVFVLLKVCLSEGNSTGSRGRPTG